MTTTMHALYLAGDHLRLREDYPRPALGAGEALIKIRLAGICSTDLEIIKGYAGFNGVLGHEFVGDVVAVADQNDGSWIGRRVVGSINVGCQECDICLGVGPEHCPRRSVLGIADRDGIFADFAALPVANLFVVPDTVTDRQAVFTEPLAAALRIREQIAIRPTTQIAVLGPGRLGLLVGQVLALAGNDVTMLGRHVSSLELPATLGLAAALVDGQEDNSYDLVVEATGNESGLVEALRLVRPLGTLVMKSTFHGTTTLDLTKLVVDEIAVFGSRCGPFAPALRLLAQGQIQVEPLISAGYGLGDALSAMEHASRPGVRKVLLEMSSTPPA